MQTNKILSASLLDLIFEGHNKDYGAYELRKNYSKRIRKAILVTLTIAGLICTSVILASTSQKNNAAKYIEKPVELADLPPKKIEPLPEPERPREVEPPRTEAYTAPIIMPTDVIDKPMPTIDDLDSAVIGIDKYKGPPDDGVPKPTDLDSNKGIVQSRPKPDDDGLYGGTVEVDAKFLGNWAAFLLKNLNGDVPRDNGAPVGRYTVVIQFVVDKEGVVSDITALTNHGYGMEAEAIRVIKKSVKWEPAIQNGRQVKAYRRQPIVFEINEE